MDPVFKNIHARQEEGKEYAPTLGQTFGAAFNLENDVVNFYDWITREETPFDPDFDYRKAMAEQGVASTWVGHLATSRNAQDFAGKLGRIQQEEKDKAILAASGWSGTVAALSAGMLSPTVFLPFAGQAKGGRALAEIVALAGAGASASEAALFLNQETRTEAEAYTGIAMGALLGGTLGAAWLSMSRGGRARLAADVETRGNFARVPVGTADDGRVTYRDVRMEAPTREQLAIELRRPDLEGRDRVATEAAVIEGQMPVGRVRLYTSDVGDDVRLYADREEAALANPGAPLRSVDVAEAEPRLPEYVQGLRADMNVLAADVAEVYRGPDPASPEFTALRADMEVEGGGMVREDDPTAIRDSVGTRDPEAAGAQVANRRNVRGVQSAPNRIRQQAMDTLGQISPLYRMQSNPTFPSLRDAAFKLDTGGLRQAGLDVAEPSASGAPIIDRVKVHDWNIAKYMLALDDAYLKYVYEGTDIDPASKSAAMAQIKSRLDLLPEGKMSFEEYNVAVYDGLSTGQVNGEIRPAVEALREFFAYYNNLHKEYLAELEAQGLEVSPLYRELMDDELGKGVREYAHQRYDTDKIQSNSSEFISDFAEHYERELQGAFERAYKRYGKRKAGLEFERDFQSLSSAEKNAELLDVEMELEAIEELPEYAAVRDARNDLRTRAREDGTSPEELKKQLADLEANASPEYKEAAEWRKELLARRRTMRKMGADAEAKIAKLHSQIDKTEGLIEGMFRHQIPAIRKADLDIASIQAKGDKALRGAEAGLDKVFKALAKREADYAKLLASSRPNSIARQKTLESLEHRRAKYELALERLVAVRDGKVAMDERLTEINALREMAVKDAAYLVRARADKLSALEERVADIEAMALTPEQVATRLEEIDTDLVNLDADFNAKWSGEGDRSGDSTLGRPDFREASAEIATYWLQKLSKADVEPGYFSARMDTRGPQLMRMMNLPYNIKQKYLVKNTESITRAYDRVMGPDLEIWRAFDGSVNGASVLREMSQEAQDLQLLIAQSSHVKLPARWVDKSQAFIKRVKDRTAAFGEGEDLFLDAKNFSDEAKEGFQELTPELRTQLVNAVNAELAHQSRNFQISIDRLRNTRMVPQDPNSLLWRGGRMLKDMNVLTMMGGVVVSSIADIARPIYQHGVGKALGKGWAPFITNLKGQSGRSFRVVSKDVNQRLGLNLEPILHSRAQAVLDLADPHMGGKSIVERGVRFLSNKTGIVALFDYWTSAMKSVAAAATHATMATYIPDVAAALRRGGSLDADTSRMLEYLRERGLRDLDIQRIAGQMAMPNGMETFSNGGQLPNIGDWDDMLAYRAYAGAVTNEVNKLIVTPGLERPNWTDENLAYSMAAQFKSFTFSATSRMTMSNLQGSDPYLMQGIAASLAFGALSYYTYAHTVGGKTQQKMEKADVNDWIYESVDRSGLLGALSIGQRIGEQIPFLAQSPLFGGEDKAYRRPSGFLGTVFGPSVGQAEKMTEFLKNMDDPEAAEKNGKLLRQMFVPYQNHFIARRAFDAVGDSINSALGG